MVGREGDLSERIATRLYMPGVFDVGTSLALDQAQAHRLRHVLRRAAGAAVAAFNESAGEWLCELTELGRGRLALNPVQQIRPPEDDPDLWLLFAPLKRARFRPGNRELI